MREGHRRPADLEDGALEGPPQERAADAVLCRLGGTRAPRAALPRAGEGALDGGQRGVGAEFSAVYQRSKKARTFSRVKERTLSREPRIGER
jgi:hypothetical protein